MKQRIEQKAAFEVLGYALRTTTVGGENMREIPKFWGRCHAEGKVAGLAPLASSFGILGLCADFDSKMEGFTYVIGAEAEANVRAPDGTARVKVPAATYAVFSCVGAMPGAIQEGWNEIMGQWFPKSPYVQASPVNFELYPAFPEGDERGDPASPKCYTEIWIPIKPN